MQVNSYTKYTVFIVDDCVLFKTVSKVMFSC